MKLTPIRILLLFLFGLSACAPAAPRTATSALQRQPVNADRAAEISAAVETLAQTQAQLRYFSAFAQVRVERGRERRAFDAALQVAPPNRLALQVLNDLGQEVANIVADGEEVLFFEAESGKTRRFEQNSEALRKTLRLPITVEELVDRILLRLPAAEVLAIEQEASPATFPAYWVVRQGDELRLDGKDPRLDRYEARESARKWRYQVEYSDYQKVESRIYPRHIAMSFRKPALRLTLNLEEISFAPPASRSIEASFDTKNH